MNWLFALLVTAGIYGLMVGLALVWVLVMHAAGVPNDASVLQAKAMGFVVTIGCSIWMYFDAKSIGFNKYKGFMSGSPEMVAVCCALFWMIVFPGYLQKRWKITHGQAEMKTEAELAAASGRPNWALILLGGIIVILAGITALTMLSISNVVAQRKEAEKKAMLWPTATANIISAEKITSTGSHLVYEYVVDGKKYSRDDKVFLTGKTFESGRQIKVHYDPAKPEDVMVLQDSQ